MKHLYFCRHGESELNQQRIFAGQTDTPLTERGRDQARLAGQVGLSLHIDTIIASPLSRAMETAQIIADQINYPSADITVNDIFIEQSFGSLEGLPWNAPDLDSYVDIETDEHLRSRAQVGLEFLQSLVADNILLVGHGSFGRQLQSLTSGQPAGAEMDNATIIELI